MSSLCVSICSIASMTDVPNLWSSKLTSRKMKCGSATSSFRLGFFSMSRKGNFKLKGKHVQWAGYSQRKLTPYVFQILYQIIFGWLLLCQLSGKFQNNGRWLHLLLHPSPEHPAYLISSHNKQVLWMQVSHIVVEVWFKGFQMIILFPKFVRALLQLIETLFKLTHATSCFCVLFMACRTSYWLMIDCSSSVL